MEVPSLKTVHLDLPPQEYAEALNLGSFSNRARGQILDCVQEYGTSRLVVFGSGSTGLAVRDVLAERFLDFVDSGSLPALKTMDFDAVLIATSPLHYPVILKTLAESLDSKGPAVITLFNCSPEVKVGLVLETQPRSGTHYAIDNLMRCLNWGYGSVFRDDGGADFKRSRDGRFYYRPSLHKESYLVKSHFFQPLHFPEYRYAKTIFQVSYLFDSYYSWGRMLSPTQEPGYRLRESSREWSMLRSYIPLNKQWLSYIKDRFFLRYEDYCSAFQSTIQSISGFLGISPLTGFERPRVNTGRAYWSDGYAERMEQAVFDCILEEFREHLDFFWPEKTDRLRYR